MNNQELPGLYIHTPFCSSKCFYCDFYSIASRSAIPAWLEALRLEMKLYEDSFGAFDSFYLGGGTPSVLDERELAVLFESVFENFSFGPAPEMTMEANPESISTSRLKTVQDFGVNRISLGVQSLDDRDLEYLGRGHRSDQALKALETCRSAGFSNISVDLIYGLETQSLQSFKKTLDLVLEFRPEHISCYQLSFEKGTTLSKMRESGRVRSIGEKLEAAFFLWTSRYLERRGYYHYEVSNFAAGREFMCRHNLKYWRHVPYLGLGPSAHSLGRRVAAHGWPSRGVSPLTELPSRGVSPLTELPSPFCPLAAPAGGPFVSCIGPATSPSVVGNRNCPATAAGSGVLGPGRLVRGDAPPGRWWNVRSVREYCRLLAEGKAPIAGSETLSREQYDMETLDLGLRTRDGVDLSVIKGGVQSERVLAQWRKSGLVKVSEGRVRPTRKGFLVADSLALMLIDAR